MLITDVWREQPGMYFCLSTKTRSGKWTDHFFGRSQFKQVRKFIKDNLDKDVYWCPHGFRRKRRLKDYAVMPKLLWADLDEADPSEMKPMPTIAWESSPGRFCGLWLVDEEVDEVLNRRLTYAVEADHGGWDVTQVLRVPGTINYKYDHQPRVRELWDDGPTYEREEIDRVLPKEEVVEPSFGEAHKIYKRYQKRLSPFARREILNGKPKAGKRSEVLWRLNKELLEAGMTTEEAFALLWVSPWNKFKDRRNGETQLRHELDKAVEQKLESVRVEFNEEAEGDYTGFAVKSLDMVKEEELDWVWYPFLARRELTILEGDPGLGKSYLAQIVGMSICDGKRLPTERRRPRKEGKVLYFDMENSASTVTKRRLVDNGCRNLKNYYQEERPFMIDDEEAIEAVYDAMERIRPDLVVFDTINVYIGRADTHKASETAQAMAHFVDIGRRFNCSVLVLRHLTKSTKEKALYRGQGSISQTGAARVVMTVGTHPDEPDTRVVAVTKLNVTKRPPALSFTINSLPDTLKHTDRSKFEWGDWLELTADDIVSVAPAMKGTQGKSTTGGGSQEEVQKILSELLEEAPMSTGAIQRAMEARGFSIKQARRAAESLGVNKKMLGKGTSRTMYWLLPK